MKRFRFLLLGLAMPAAAQEPTEYWDSVRESRYEWTCEDAGGNVLSGHTRQDKAEVACSNRALSDGLTYYVRSGVYRIFRINDPVTTPPVPEPEPEPIPVPDPGDAQVKFGPVSEITQYPATISALAQDNFRWEITFTLNRIRRQVGLVSRDESGQAERGHLSVWVESGTITVRHQDIAGGAESVKLESTTLVEAGREYAITVSVSSDAGIALFVDGILEDSNSIAFGLAGNNLPLTLGGLCSRCAPGVGPNAAIDGRVYLEIHGEPMELPQPASFELMWTNPTERVDGAALLPGEIMAINLYQTSPGGRNLIARVDPDDSGYEVTGVQPGVEYCFVATAVANGESDDSNIACGIP